MAKLSLSQMELYARAAGLPDPAKWAAIGMAESSGRTDVVNSIGCVGIWQINQPVHVKSHPRWTVSWLKDPMHNAQAAKVIYDAQGMGAWQAYTSGAWRKYYKGSSSGGASQAAWWDIIPGTGLAEKGGEAVAGAGSVVTEVSRIAQAVGKAGNWISDPQNWIRIGYVAIGGVLVVVGLQMVVRSKALDKLGPALGDAVETKTKGLVSARREAKSEQKKKAADAEKRQARVNEAYAKTRARSQARADERAAQAQKKAAAKAKAAQEKAGSDE